MQTNGQAAENSRPCPSNADDFFHRALDLHRQGETDSAESLYRQTISLCPEHVDACFYLAVLRRSMGAPDEACFWFDRAHGLLPEEATIAYELGITRYFLGQHQMAIEHFHKVLSLDDTHWQAAYNLGTAHLAQGNTNEAIKAYQRAAQLNPQDGDIHFNLGLACKRAGRLEEAMQSYHCAMEIAPDDAEVHYNLALVYKELGCRAEAITSLEIAVALRPEYGAAHGNLGVLYLDHDEVDKAIACYQRLIELDHNAVSAHHILAALTGETTLVAPSSYIAELFDSFSGHFEERLLVDLEYRTPWELKSLLLTDHKGPACFERLLDLGCGTGLVGQIFQDISGCRVGVDLSAKMVEAAAAKKVYDELVVAEIVTFLEQNREPFDLIVAADVLIYVGELDRIFATLGRGLAKNGRFLFSTEQLAGQGYQLRQSGRYAHSFSYIEAMAFRHGFRILSSQSANIRKEKGKWILGELFLLGI
ncbi:MAG: tetratricopeptide repeat protein [Desulfobulbaceae bacterium]|nr:tetratricopeptide repeat protein [Desulfobulbaceae bacterium]HIJ89948.1 tetratricopeptide repeat protein [Deltaproteobacteria bacterium]